MAEARTGGPRRQARGERRIAQILDAAAEVFAERGYEATTTNAIAAAAGISPGSLYQFFGNKDQIVRALAERYAADVTAMHDEAFPDGAAHSTEALVERVLAPLVRFNREHRAFKALFARTDLPPALTEAAAPLQEATVARVVAALAAHSPATPPAQLRRAAVVGIQLAKALLPLIAAADAEEGEWLGRHLRRLLVAHVDTTLAPP